MNSKSGEKRERDEDASLGRGITDGRREKATL